MKMGLKATEGGRAGSRVRIISSLLTMFIATGSPFAKFRASLFAPLREHERLCR